MGASRTRGRGWLLLFSTWDSYLSVFYCFEYYGPALGMFYESTLGTLSRIASNQPVQGIRDIQQAARYTYGSGVPPGSTTGILGVAKCLIRTSSR